MPLSFLVPAFLAGLAALAIPIAIHLSRRVKRDPVAFPSLMFLERVPHKRTEKRQIHRWPLFLLRSLAVFLLVLAFARPFFDREVSPDQTPTSGDREVVVLLDNSYSMTVGDRWERAVSAADEIVNGLSGGDRGTVILFDSGAETVSESTTDRAVLRSALQTAQPGVRTTRYAPALRYAARILSSSPLPRHELVVISDFQRSGWDSDGGETSSLRLPRGTLVNTISVADEDPGNNISIVGADFERSTAAGRERAVVTTRLVSNGLVPDEVTVSLDVDGRTVETRTTTFGEGTSGSVTFEPLTLPESGTLRGTVRIPADALQSDNTLHFVLSTDQRIPVLILEGAGTTRGASYFLERALSIGTNPGFRVEVRRGGELRAADLQSNPVVILNQTPMPSGAPGDRLRSYVEEGGGLIFLMGENTPGDWPGVLPNVSGAVDRTRDGGVTLGYIDTGHPVFEVFAAPRTGDFTAARVFRYRPIPSGAFPRVLARYGDGGIALAERPVGEGRVLVWTTTLDTDWNDLALQPIFLPFLHQMTKYAAGFEPPRSWLTVGTPFDVRGSLPAGQQEAIAVGPGGEQVRVAAGTPLQLEEVGFYEVRDPESASRLIDLAVNVDRAEADLSGFDPEEMRTALLAAASADVGSALRVELTPADRERQQNGWWYLVIGVFILLAAETLYSNQIRQRAGKVFAGRKE